MKERPILMNTENVRAILEGRKTQTRRVIKPQPKQINDAFDGTWEWKEEGHYFDDLTLAYTLRESCPYEVGQRLWVRETWAGNYLFGIDYKADGYDYGYDDKMEPIIKWKPSIHMPKRYARIWLEITDIRVERVQDISEGDAKAEGVAKPYILIKDKFTKVTPVMIEHGEIGTFRFGFGSLCDSINLKSGHGWEVNPWNWVIGFKVVKFEEHKNINTQA